ncbi:uncharacterized protein [Branchiostoma lanceolatum]|uniref:uncharacterized protein n=1 Tax=Branchiostoma lanceolatum TaxID=7740 RepID=UPI003452F96D
MGDWTYGICGCFNNFGVCIISYFLPCITAGRNAEKVGMGSCLYCGALSILGCVGWYVVAKTREETRGLRGIDGSLCGDLLMTLICPFCVVVQTAQELELTEGSPQSIARE